jgi:hypothetical protein
VAPRLGIIFQPGAIGSERLVLSAGRFYQPLSLYLSSQMHLVSAYMRQVSYGHDPRIDTTGGNLDGDFQGHMTNVKDLRGQYYDEITLGYETELASGLKAGARLIYRNLGEAVNTGFTPAGQVYGNPGSPPMEIFPKATREYRAMELSLENNDPAGLSFQASYVLSRNYGNYEGLFDVTFMSIHGGQELSPNGCSFYYSPVMSNNSLGLLPDDRTHQFKFYCSYPISPGFTMGVSGYWTSGTPLNELGTSTPSTGRWPIFLRPRGSLGRSPSVWDLNFRLVHDLGGMMKT